MLKVSVVVFFLCKKEKKKPSDAAESKLFGYDVGSKGVPGHSRRSWGPSVRAKKCFFTNIAHPNS